VLSLPSCGLCEETIVKARSTLRVEGGSPSPHFPLADADFAMQSAGMETNNAAENLQVIRTLMERSALYRRALAPIMTWCGAWGIIAGLVGWKWGLNSTFGFAYFWYGVAVLALGGSLLLVRRQALRDGEPFWSPPTRRVVIAMLLPLALGMFAGLLMIACVKASTEAFRLALIVVWAWFYGCGLNSAGFFISRGIRILGWIFGVIGCLLPVLIFCFNTLSTDLVMGVVFGVVHLLSGIYLYFTESRKNLP
jgi:hypothetical protein